ncbi:hypothetical protein [Streptomyces boninensis]|uniref:hypothetical protein n=1 Tax=Streptomyces boninensis TaxID=2039455 RepID=UPI003B21C3CA
MNRLPALVNRPTRSPHAQRDAEHLLAAGPCAACAERDDAVARWLRYYTHHSRTEAAGRTRIRASMGLCPPHTRHLLGDPASAAWLLPQLYDLALDGGLRLLAVPARRPAPHACPACVCGTRAAARARTVLLRALDRAPVFAAVTGGAVCVPHLAAAAAALPAEEGVRVAEAVVERFAARERERARADGAAEAAADLRAGTGAGEPAGTVVDDRVGAGPYDRAGTGPHARAGTGPYDRAGTGPHDRAETDPHARAETDPHARAETDPHDRAETDPHARAETDPHARAETDPHARAETDPHARAETDPHARAGTGPYARAETGPHAPSRARMDDPGWSAADDLEWIAGPDPDAPIRARLHRALDPLVDEEDRRQQRSVLDRVDADLRLDCCPLCLAEHRAARRLLRWAAWAGPEPPDGEDSALCGRHLHDLAADGGPNLAVITAANAAVWKARFTRFHLLRRQGGGARRAAPERLLHGPDSRRCRACREEALAVRRQRELLTAVLYDTERARRYETSHGICLRHALTWPDPPAPVFAALRARTALLRWELDEALRKQEWHTRHEVRGAELGVGLRAPTLIDGRVYAGMPPQPRAVPGAAAAELQSARRPEPEDARPGPVRPEPEDRRPEPEDRRPEPEDRRPPAWD